MKTQSRPRPQSPFRGTRTGEQGTGRISGRKSPQKKKETKKKNSMAERSYDPTKDPHLANWRERKQMGIKMMQCPQCGKKGGYKPYIYPDGTMIDEQCGKCDHESSCGYHLTPKEWFKDHKTDGDHTNKNYTPPPPPPMIVLPSRMVYDMYCLNKNACPNPLLRYWTNLFRNVKDEHKAIAEEYMTNFKEALRKFAVGTMPGNYTVWWIVDDDNRIRSGKAMMYLPNGHRDKESKGNFRWLHHMGRLFDSAIPEEAEYVGCLFGLHQIYKNQSIKQVNIVESEKTAVLMSAFMPEMTWMATMGLSALNAQRLDPLISRGLKIVLYPDADGVEKWLERMKEIRKDAPKAKISLNPYARAHSLLTGSHDDILDVMERDYILLYSK